MSDEPIGSDVDPATSEQISSQQKNDTDSSQQQQQQREQEELQPQQQEQQQQVELQEEPQQQQQQPAADMEHVEERRKEMTQSDEPQLAEEQPVEGSSVAQSDASITSQAIETDSVSEQQSSAAAQAAESDSSTLQTNNDEAAVDGASTDGTQQLAELPVDSNPQTETALTNAAEGDTTATAAVDSESVPHSDSHLQSTIVQSPSADLPQAASSSDPSSSNQLIATLLAAPSPPPAQPAPIPRDATIHVRLLLSSSDEPVLVPVSIVREYLSAPKAFLGGYRHHVSGRVKHHASVQTDRRQTGKGAGRERVTRDTQTVETATRSAQSGRSVGTQMARADYHIGEEGETGQGERVIEAGEYVSSDVLEAQREERAKQIQCWLRVCFAVRRMKQLKAAKDGAESSERQATEAAADRKRHEEDQQIHRRMHPKSAADFKLLYAELSAWRQHEAARIHTLELPDDEREAQLSRLLSKEVKLLQTIDRLKIRAGRERKEEAVHRRLEMMQSPQEWTTSAGHHVEVVTPYTVRAQELTSLYQALLLPVQMHAEEEKEAQLSGAGSGCLSWDGRVDVLLHCKYVVGEMASQLSADILQLIEREQEWVRRRHATPGWHADQALAGMRKRLAALFLQFVQTPAYNPSAAVYVDSVGRDGKQKMQEMIKKPLADRELRKDRPVDEGQDRILTARVQT